MTAREIITPSYVTNEDLTKIKESIEEQLRATILEALLIENTRMFLHNKTPIEPIALPPEEVVFKDQKDLRNAWKYTIQLSAARHLNPLFIQELSKKCVNAIANHRNLLMIKYGMPMIPLDSVQFNLDLRKHPPELVITFSVVFPSLTFLKIVPSITNLILPFVAKW